MRLSFSDVEERVVSRMAELKARRVAGLAALATGNCSAFVISYLALRRLGVAVVAMDGALPERQKVATCGEMGVRHLLLRDRIADIEPAATAAESAPYLPDDIGLVKLTSGSTGRPTGACFTDEVLYAGSRQIAEGMELDAEQRVLLCIPLSHSYGFDNGVLSLLVAGTPLILQPSIFPADLLRALDESGAHFLPLVPPLVRSLGRATWPDDLSLRRVICAGGALLPEAARRFRDASGRHVHNFYGSTETGGISFETAPEEPEARGTVGRPLPGVSVELDDSRRVVVRSAANRVARWGPEGVGVDGRCARAHRRHGGVDAGRAPAPHGAHGRHPQHRRTQDRRGGGGDGAAWPSTGCATRPSSASTIRRAATEPSRFWWRTAGRRYFGRAAAADAARTAPGGVAAPSPARGKLDRQALRRLAQRRRDRAVGLGSGPTAARLTPACRT